MVGAPHENCDLTSPASTRDPCDMPSLSPSTLTHSEQDAILRATSAHPRDHAIYSIALGTGLRLAEIVGLNVGDVFPPMEHPRTGGCERRRSPAVVARFMAFLVAIPFLPSPIDRAATSSARVRS